MDVKETNRKVIEQFDVDLDVPCHQGLMQGGCDTARSR
jgi:hypothetical protein